MEYSPRALLLVASGGALGASLRYVTYVLLQGAVFPWATLVVNVLGSFVLAFLLFYVIIDANTDFLSLFVMMGILEAFTTFSPFSVDTVLLYMDKGPLIAVLNVSLNVLMCIVGAASGRLLALRLL